MDISLDWLLALIALPKIGLPAIFIISFISATLVPTGSEPAVFAYIKLNPDMLWPAIIVATIGNVAGGMVDWWMGYAAKLAMFKLRSNQARRQAAKRKYKHRRLSIWIRRHGPRILLLSWLPGIGDPLCVAAGWLRLPWKSCLIYMTIGKFVRYVTMTMLLLAIPNSFWTELWNRLG